MARVVIIGAGNAGLAAALSASEAGAEVTVLEIAEESDYGSDSFFSGGLFRVAYRDFDELEKIVGPLDLGDAEGLDELRSYSTDDFLADWGRVTGYRFDEALSELIVSSSQDALGWLADSGVTFHSPIVVDENGHARHSRPGWHGGFVEAAGAGPGLCESLLSLCGKAGIDIRYGTAARGLTRDDQQQSWIVDVHSHTSGAAQLTADSVIIASGGFQADPEWRTRCLGPGWDLAKVRGSRHNTGHGMKMAFSVGAASFGAWSGCHAVAWSVGSGDAGRADANHVFERESYPFGITVNLDGVRFIDEGSDFGAYTYAKYGREILKQPEQSSWQLFDSQAFDLYTSEYHYKNPEAARITANTLDQLIARLADRGLDAERLRQTIEEFNAAVDDSNEFSPYLKDGRRTRGLAIDKTNWARGLTTGPFHAYEVTCGITFTFGGLHVDTDAQVLDQSNNALPSLYACGEAVGGLHYFNYASGTGLTSGTVLGRIAGRRAAGSPA